MQLLSLFIPMEIDEYLELEHQEKKKEDLENSKDNYPFLNIDILPCFSTRRFCVGESYLIIRDPVSPNFLEVKTSLINIKENGASVAFLSTDFNNIEYC